MGTCDRCGGSGTYDCRKCNGSGTLVEMELVTVVDVTPIFNSKAKECPGCHGSGKQTCAACEGTGRV